MPILRAPRFGDLRRRGPSSRGRGDSGGRRCSAGDRLAYAHMSALAARRLFPTTPGKTKCSFLCLMSARPRSQAGRPGRRGNWSRGLARSDDRYHVENFPPVRRGGRRGPASVSRAGFPLARHGIGPDRRRDRRARPRPGGFPPGSSAAGSSTVPLRSMRRRPVSPSRDRACGRIGRTSATRDRSILPTTLGVDHGSSQLTLRRSPGRGENRPSSAPRPRSVRAGPLGF